MLGDRSLPGKLKRDTSAVEQMAAVTMDPVTAEVVTLTDYDRLVASSRTNRMFQRRIL